MAETTSTNNPRPIFAAQRPIPPIRPGIAVMMRKNDRDATVQGQDRLGLRVIGDKPIPVNRQKQTIR